MHERSVVIPMAEGERAPSTSDDGFSEVRPRMLPVERRADLSATIGVCVLFSASISALVAAWDPIWWTLGLFLGLFWGGLVAVIAGGLSFGLLSLLRTNAPRGVLVAAGGMITGGGALAFDLIVLQQELDAFNLATSAAIATIGATLVGLRSRRAHP